MNPDQTNEPSEAEHLRVYGQAHAVLAALISEDWAAADVLVADLAAGGPAAIGPLLTALAGTFAVAVPGLHTPHGVALLRAEAQRLAGLAADAEAAAFEAAVLRAQTAALARAAATEAGS